MNLAIRARQILVALVGSALMVFVVLAPASAQDEISDSHLKAARAAIAALKATEQFDQVLPQAAQALRVELVRKNPDMRELINSVVDNAALKLVDRRADLEKEAATAYARVFSEDELNAIATFYNSPAGQKLLSDGQIAQREVLQAAQIWQRGIARDLADAVGKQLDQATASNSSQDAQQQAPAQDGQAPAQANQ